VADATDGNSLMLPWLAQRHLCGCPAYTQPPKCLPCEFHALCGPPKSQKELVQPNNTTCSSSPQHTTAADCPQTAKQPNPCQYTCTSSLYPHTLPTCRSDLPVCTVQKAHSMSHMCDMLWASCTCTVVQLYKYKQQHNTHTHTSCFPLRLDTVVPYVFVPLLAL
jgi:hypothetical protein